MSLKLKGDQHNVFVISNAFTSGTFATGGSFKFTLPSIGFIPDFWIVRQVTWSGTSDTGLTLVLNCSNVGRGPIALFTDPSVQVTATHLQYSAEPNTIITNHNNADLNGQQLDFFVTRASGATVTSLVGDLLVLMEAVKKEIQDDGKLVKMVY